MTRKSRFHGVHWHCRDERWVAKITKRGRANRSETINLGNFTEDQEELAARVRDYVAKRVQGPDAVLNFDGELPAEVTLAWIENKMVRAGLLVGDEGESE